MMEVRHNDEGAATITIQHVKQLIERKDRMETEMQAIVDSLQVFIHILYISKKESIQYCMTYYANTLN